MNTEKQMNRRTLLKRSLAVVGAVTAVPILHACGGGDDKLSCTDVSSLSLEQRQTRDSLQYVDQTADPAKRCDNCQLYTQPQGGNGCGGCSVVAGPINPAGYCASWVAKQG